MHKGDAGHKTYGNVSGYLAQSKDNELHEYNFSVSFSFYKHLILLFKHL